LSLFGFTTGLSVWLFSTPMVSNVQTSPQSGSPPSEECQPLVEPKVDSFPSSLVQPSSASSSSSGKKLKTSN